MNEARAPGLMGLVSNPSSTNCATSAKLFVLCLSFLTCAMTSVASFHEAI